MMNINKDYNISRNYNRGKSFRFSKWEYGEVYKNDDFIQDFVSFDGILYACNKSFTKKCPNYVLQYSDDTNLDWHIVIDGTKIGIKSIDFKFGINSSEKDEPEIWYEEIPSLHKGGYLWTKVTWHYLDGKETVHYQKTYIPKDGLSAYQIWLDNGNSGTEIDFLNSLKGGSAEQFAEWDFWKK